MAEIIVHPAQDLWQAQSRAEKRGNRIEIRGDRLVERVPKPRRTKRGGSNGPAPVA